MKIFTSAQIHELDKYTIENEPVKSIDLMERAAKAITQAHGGKIGVECGDGKVTFKADIPIKQ
jgi:NAD(P)H-hydrate repair Nnr-like enzyme with NAD(P)H-hydrate epimerase domain